MSQRVQILLITGMSGAGKSSVAKCLEDLGYHCLDNLPITLLRNVLEAPEDHLPNLQHIAVVTDLRTPQLASELPPLLQAIDRDKVDPVVLFLDTSDDVLIRRYSETRRRHPLAKDGMVIEGIRRERAGLETLRAVADKVMDTSEWTIHEVRRQIEQAFGERTAEQAGLTVNLVSFGFKRGALRGADLMFDVRYLPNPYFEPELRPLSGLDGPIIDYLHDKPEFDELRQRLIDLLNFLLPNFSREMRSYLTVGVGCTGGRHRSVAMTEALASALSEAHWNVRVVHRDLDLQTAAPESPVISSDRDAAPASERADGTGA